jgi:hypothetical protein
MAILATAIPRITTDTFLEMNDAINDEIIWSFIFGLK